MGLVLVLVNTNNKLLPVPSVIGEVIETELLDFHVVVQVPVPCWMIFTLNFTVSAEQIAVLSEVIVMVGSATTVIW